MLEGKYSYFDIYFLAGPIKGHQMEEEGSKEWGRCRRGAGDFIKRHTFLAEYFMNSNNFGSPSVLGLVKI